MRDKPTLHSTRASAPKKYRVVAIGEKLECRGSLARAINNRGQAILIATDSNTSSYLWANNDLRRIIPSYHEWSCWAYGLNDKGIVVGGAGLTREKQIAFYWKDGKMHLLPTLAGHHTWATGITNDDIIYGVSFSRGGVARAVCWKKEKLSELKIAETDTFITGVSSEGPFTGFVLTEGKSRPFICHKDRLEFLPQPCIGAAINARASIAGAYFQERDTEPFVYANREFTRIPTLGGSQATAQGINKQGWVVGQSLLRAPQWHGFLWCGNTLYDLNTLATGQSKPVVKTAMGINDTNVIAGSAIIAGKEIACLLVPDK